MELTKRFLNGICLVKFETALPFSKYFSFQGLYAWTLAVCLVSASAQPLFWPVAAAPAAAAALPAIPAAGGVVVAGAAGATALTPLGALLVIKGAALAGAAKVLLIRELLESRNNNRD